MIGPKYSCVESQVLESISFPLFSQRHEIHSLPLKQFKRQNENKQKSKVENIIKAKRDLGRLVKIFQTREGTDRWRRNSLRKIDSQGRLNQNGQETKISGDKKHCKLDDVYVPERITDSKEVIAEISRFVDNSKKKQKKMASTFIKESRTKLIIHESNHVSVQKQNIPTKNKITSRSVKQIRPIKIRQKANQSSYKPNMKTQPTESSEQKQFLIQTSVCLQKFIKQNKGFSPWQSRSERFLPDFQF